jgi:hypothetical protein
MECVGFNPSRYCLLHHSEMQFMELFDHSTLDHGNHPKLNSVKGFIFYKLITFNYSKLITFKIPLDLHSVHIKLMWA